MAPVGQTSALAPDAPADIRVLADRLARNDAGDQALRKASGVLQALIRDLPATDDLLLTEQSRNAFRVVRDHHPELYLVYRGAIRQRAGKHLVDLLDHYVGAPLSRPARAIEVLGVADVLAQHSPIWLVDGILPETGLASIYGASGDGKTFIAVDLACAIARGIPWFGRRVQGGAVLYVAAEGRTRDRLACYLQEFNLDVGDFASLRVIEGAIDLSGATADLEQLCERICQIGPIRLVVIDTIARVLFGADENAARDMGGFLVSLDRIREASGGLVVCVHHSGKDASRGARGHSSLRAAVDTELELTRDAASGTRTLRVAKQRDAADGITLHFDLRPVALIGDEAGRGSCIVMPTDTAPKAPAPHQRPLTADERIALDALREELKQSGTPLPATSELPGGKPGVQLAVWRDRFFARLGDERDAEAATKRQAWHRGRKGLLARKIAGVWEEWAWLW